MELTAPWATLIVAAVALLVGGATIAQKWRNDRRDAWWKRAQWAIDKSLSAERVDRQIGAEAMGVLVQERFAVSKSDVRVLKIALLHAMVDRR